MAPSDAGSDGEIDHDDLANEFSEELYEVAKEYHDRGLSETSLKVVAKETIKEVNRDREF